MSKKLVFALAFVPFLCIAKDDGLTEFDFCGIPDSLCAVSNLGVQVACAELPVESQERVTDAAQRQALGFSLVFLADLSMAELRACIGDGESYRSRMDMVGDLLRFLLRNERVVGVSVFDCNLARTEMSLSRIINGKFGRRIEVRASDIKRWIPEIEGKSSAARVNLERFRTLLLIGAAIDKYRLAHNRLPDKLNSLVDEIDLGISESDLSSGSLRVEYRTALDFWKLRLGSYERRVPEPIYDFVPAVYHVAGECVDEIWFASAYTQKRNELFENGCLPSDDPLCRCLLKGCIVVRGGSALSSEK